MTKIEQFAKENGFFGVDFLFSLENMNYYDPYYEHFGFRCLRVIKEDENGILTLMPPDESSVIVSMYNNPYFKKALEAMRPSENRGDAIFFN